METPGHKSCLGLFGLPVTTLQGGAATRLQAVPGATGGSLSRFSTCQPYCQPRHSLGAGGYGLQDSSMLGVS